MFHASIINLRINRERVAYIDRTLPGLHKLALQLQQDVNISTTRIRIDADAIHGNQTTDPTARQALTDVFKDVQELQEDIIKLTIERQRRAAWIEEAETALNLLSERYRLIVTLRDVVSLSWEDVANQISDKINDYISASAVRKGYIRAIAKIESFFNDADPAPDNMTIVKKKRIYNFRQSNPVTRTFKQGNYVPSC